MIELRRDMLIKLLLTTCLAVMLMTAACRGGGVSISDAPAPPESREPSKNAEALAYYTAGVWLAEEGYIEEAIDRYEKSVGLNPRYAAAYNNLGTIYSSLGQYQRAIRNFNESISLNSQHPVTYYNRGNANDGLGEFQQAVQDYTEAVRLDPLYKFAYGNRAISNTLLGKEFLAQLDVDHAVELGVNRASLMAAIDQAITNGTKR